MDKERVSHKNLRKMTKKGYIEILEYICKNQPVHYIDIMNFGLTGKVVESRATVTIIMRELLKLNLVERTIVDAQPIRTVYKPTTKGEHILKLLQEIEAAL
jgi:DNA-binding HxlR family transcriptional regulator